MFSTLTSRPTAVATPPQPATNHIPSIRLISATPSATGSSSEANSSVNHAIDSSWASIPSPLAPKAEVPSRKRLVPKKSKLGLLGGGRDKERGKDLSDVVRRVGASSSSRGGFEIYVDPTVDPDIGEIVMVKKKKSRVALDGMKWGPLGEVTNVPSVTPKEAPALLKVKTEEKEKWWSIGRGRKDSKEKTKEAKENKSRAISPPLREPVRSKTPEPLKLASEARARFNSLDSGILLNTPPIMGPSQETVRSGQPQQFSQQQSSKVSDPPVTYSRSATPTFGGLLAPPSSGLLAPPSNANQGSIALRAIRSVRSLARIGSWNDKEAVPVKKEKKEKTSKEGTIKEGKKKKEKKTKEEDVEGGEKKKKKKEKKEKSGTIRHSTSSFEAGALTASPEADKTLGKKKHSILGLGLPSTMRLPTTRSGSTASSLPPVSISGNRLSVESAVKVMGRDRAGSTMSTASSLRPLSVTSTISRASSNSSGASVKWDEEGLQTVREQRKRERASKSRPSTDGEEMKNEAKTENRHSLEGRRRTPLSEVFPGVQRDDSPAVSVRRAFPILTIEEATSDGHDAPDDEELLDEAQVVDMPAVAATPVKKARARPVSEQLLGRSRPKPIREDEDGVLSILDAATNELAQLINNLDLEATPCTPDMTPLRPSPLNSEKKDSTDYSGSPKKKKLVAESPLKNGLRASLASISSLRPYSQSRGPATRTATTAIHPDLIGQQIAPWPTLIQSLSPLKESPPSTKKTRATPPHSFRKTHKRTMTPGPEPEPDPVFLPLGPPKARVTSSTIRTSTSPTPKEPHDAYGTIRAPSSLTFGSRSSSSRPGSRGSTDEMGLLIPGPVFTRSTSSTSSHRRSSLAPLSESRSTKGSRGSQGSVRSSRGIPIPPEARKVLGMGGTMGGSDTSGYAVPELDASDPDSDVPDELRILLAGGSHSDRDSVGDTLSFRGQDDVLDRAFSDSSESHVEELPVARSAVSPFVDLPIFRASVIDEDDNQADLDECGNTSEEDTKKSFDFTGELKKLNESGGSDRRSFVEQLENAFKTPAKVDLRYDFGAHLKDGMLHVEVPPVPKVPVELSTALCADDSSYGSSGFDSLQGSQSRIIDMKEPTMLQSTHTEKTFETGSDSQFATYNVSRIVDVAEPTLLLGPTSFTTNSTHEVIIAPESPPSLNNSLAISTNSAVSSNSRTSDGELNTSFRFGGLRNSESPSAESEKPLTLSDIIPSPSHARSLSNSSLMDEGDSVFKSILAKAAGLPQPRPRLDSHQKHGDNDARFSWKPVTRPSSGISFGGLDSFEEVRRGFEFSDNRPAFYPAPSRRAHRAQDSVFSIASVSSYGRVLNAGSNDPFDYGLPSLMERPSREDMSISMSMTVDDTFSFLNHQPRRRIDSDASSFYFQAPIPQAGGQSSGRGHHRHESNLSISSQGPPISRYNRSYGTRHRRDDSNTSASSVAISYAMHGANGGRAAWARHRQESSVDSVMSDFSAMHLGRPGLGDKMFERDEHMPLSAIAASPNESVFAKAQRNGNRSSFDYDSILDDREGGSNEDSLFDRSDYRSSRSDSDLFGNEFSQPHQGGLLPPGQFRPLSITSLHSLHSPMKEDDTMISLLGGGHVRRCSIGSIMEASPCVRVEKRKHALFNGMQTKKGYDKHYDSPNKARIVEKPSIASTSSYQFGGERMIKAQHGLLERQSLEDSCLIADGEDLSTSFHAVPVFSRPGPAARSRSSTCTSSSGGDTPPLSASDGSSISEGSQSSIDLSHLNMILSNATHPISTVSRTRVRARARGHGHRRRYSQAHASRSSVYETIEEEMSNASSPARTIASKKSSPTQCQPIFVVDQDTASINSVTEETVWDDERGIVALRKYYALKDEAQTTVVESKRQWLDTPFSVFALQSFHPPKEPSGMQALLEYSVQNYGPLPSELRPRRVRSRTQSRPSPYPQARLSKATISPEQTRSKADLHATPVLKQLPVNSNILSVAPSLEALKPFSPLVVNVEPKRENAFGLATRPRVASTTRRTALGWSKRSNGKSSTGQKENQGVTMTPGESLRINRPRPKGRATPATQGRPIRV